MEQSATITKNSMLQEAMRKGLILAIIHIVVFLIIFYLFPNKLTGFSYVAFIILLNLLYCFFQAKKLRTDLGGYVDFGKVFTYTFILLVANGIIQAIFGALFLFIEPSFPDVMAQSQLDTSLYWAQRFGAPDETLEKMTEQFDPKDITKRFTIVGQLFGFGVGLLFYALGSVIIGFMVRKQEPIQF